jgi:regulator of sigma E protease
MSVVVTILLVVLVLGVLIFIHELGHFLAARLVGATVFEFALGFGPRIISKEYKGTIYTVRLLPLGGFVNILGDGDPTKEDLERFKEADIEQGNLKNKSKWAQAFVMLAGILMNILLAIFCYFLVLGFSDWKIALSYEYADFNPIGAQVTKEREMDVPYEVVEDSLADESGMPDQGYITHINNEEVEYVEDISELISGNDEVNIRACSQQGEDCNVYRVEVDNEGKIGIAIGINYFVYLDYSDNKILSGPSHFINNVRLIGRVFGSLFREARETGDYSALSQSVSGPVGIFFIVDYFKDLGWIPFFSLIADLSLSLAIMNILPIPALDGGRVLIVAIEGLLGKDLNPKIEAIIINISFILLMVLVVFVMIKDITSIDELKSLFE